MILKKHDYLRNLVEDLDEDGRECLLIYCGNHAVLLDRSNFDREFKWICSDLRLFHAKTMLNATIDRQAFSETKNIESSIRRYLQVVIPVEIYQPKAKSEFIKHILDGDIEVPMPRFVYSIEKCYLVYPQPKGKQDVVSYTNALEKLRHTLTQTLKIPDRFNLINLMPNFFFKDCRFEIEPTPIYEI